MPKVGKFSYNYDHLKGTYGEYDVNFGSVDRRHIKQQDKYFWVRIPPAITEIIGIKSVHAPTNGEVITKFKKVMDEYYSKDQSERRVIGYQFEGEDKTDEYSWMEKQVNKKYLSIKFVIGTEVTVGKQKFFRRDDDTRLYELGNDRHYSDYREFTFIAHTKEAEDWFKKTHTTLQKIIDECKKFFDQPESKFVAAMNNSKLLTFGK